MSNEGVETHIQLLNIMQWGCWIFKFIYVYSTGVRKFKLLKKIFVGLNGHMSQHEWLELVAGIGGCVSTRAWDDTLYSFF